MNTTSILFENWLQQWRGSIAKPSLIAFLKITTTSCSKSGFGWFGSAGESDWSWLMGNYNQNI